MPNFGKVFQWLTNFDSHGIYEQNRLGDLADAGITFDSKTGILMVDDKEHYPPLETSGGFAKTIKARGLGGNLTPGKWIGFSGYAIADFFAEALGLGHPGAQYLGRGRIFEACAEAIRVEAKKRGEWEEVSK